MGWHCREDMFSLFYQLHRLYITGIRSHEFSVAGYRCCAHVHAYDTFSASIWLRKFSRFLTSITRVQLSPIHITPSQTLPRWPSLQSSSTSAILLAQSYVPYCFQLSSCSWSWTTFFHTSITDHGGRDVNIIYFRLYSLLYIMLLDNEIFVHTVIWELHLFLSSFPKIAERAIMSAVWKIRNEMIRLENKKCNRQNHFLHIQ